MNKIILGVAIMAISTMAMADSKVVNKPEALTAKIEAIKGKVASKVESKSAKTNKARVKKGDWILLHDGSTVKKFCQIDPLDEVSFPATLTCIVDTQKKCEQEIKKLGLK